MKNKSVTNQLFKIIFGIYFSVTIILTAIQMISTFISARNDVKEELVAQKKAVERELANALNKVNEVDNYTLLNWNKLTKLGFSYPILKSNNLVYMGLRDIESQEKEYILKNSIKNFNVQEIRLKGIDNFIEDILKCFTSVKKIYISFDVDSLDPDSVSQGTGTPVNNGFEIVEVISIIKAIIKTNKVIALEVSEINPLLDNKGNMMAEKTFEIIKNIFKN